MFKCCFSQTLVLAYTSTKTKQGFKKSQYTHINSHIHIKYVSKGVVSIQALTIWFNYVELYCRPIMYCNYTFIISWDYKGYN